MMKNIFCCSIIFVLFLVIINCINCAPVDKQSDNGHNLDLFVGHSLVKRSPGQILKLVDDQKDDDIGEIDDDLEDDNHQPKTTTSAKEDDDDKKDDDDDDDDDKSQANHKLLIIMLDGFRSDYITRDHKALKGFERLSKNGIYAKEVDPVIPAVSYPNYYSISTGLWPEEHGFVDDNFRSNKNGEVFEPHPNRNASNEHWWLNAEPLWITAEKKRIKTALFNWPGCEVQSSNVKKRPQPFVCIPYEGYPGKKIERVAFRQWLERVVEDFRQHKYRLAMIHYETVDILGHKYGPHSKITKQAVRDVDSAIYDLQDALTKNDLDDDVNIYIVSDNGLISTSQFKPIVLGDIIDMNDIELTFSEGSHVQLLAESGKHDKVLEALLKSKTKGLNIYGKDSLPERFHLRESSNLLPIYLTADEGYYIEVDNDDELEAGEDGYDVEFVDEMETIMYASGPDIQRSEILDEMEQVDHYNVFCHLLDFDPKPNNGSISVARRILRKFEDIDEDEDNSASKENSEEDSKEDDDDDDDDDNSVSALQFSPTIVFCLLFVSFALFHI